jgi:hypothetical protein
MKGDLVIIKSKLYFIVNILLPAFAGDGFGQDPFIRNQFSANPLVRVFGNSVYVYPSHSCKYYSLTY